MWFESRATSTALRPWRGKVEGPSKDLLYIVCDTCSAKKKMHVFFVQMFPYFFLDLVDLVIIAAVDLLSIARSIFKPSFHPGITSWQIPPHVHSIWQRVFSYRNMIKSYFALLGQSVQPK